MLSVAVGRSGQVLANGERLTPSAAERLREEMPLLGAARRQRCAQLAAAGPGRREGGQRHAVVVADALAEILTGCGTPAEGVNHHLPALAQG